MDSGASPAQRYAAARVRAQRSRTVLSRFRDQYDFPLDAFQESACEALESGRSVLVAAPTGAGKTVVGEFAVALALDSGSKCFYTAPIKALSNQKYNDLVAAYGSDSVGLLTGDNSINGDAPVVVMTTEVLRNMLYSGSSTLDGLSFVVMDEVHYLADRFRGAVWEEVIIHLPARVQIAALSATVSNAEEFGEWLEAVRGDTDIVVEEHRPVPLWQQVLAAGRLMDLFVDDDQSTVNPELVRMSRDDQRAEKLRGQRPPRGGRRRRDLSSPARFDIIDTLQRAGLLPTISFIFSRAGCDAAVRQCVAAGMRLTTPEERDEIRAIVEEMTSEVPQADLGVLGYPEWADALGRGIAAHHAGMLPRFKEVVEVLFQRGLIKAVFATETLALGINMPARSVVLERLVKWNGEAHVDVTAAEYTQLTGRAGRRGIDVEGTAVVVWHSGLDPRVLAGLASARTYPLRSSFKPSYNMAVNLVRQMGHHVAREVLETSFAQFQADRSVVGLAAQIRRNEEALDGYQKAMTCHLGDFREYAALRHSLSQRERELTRLGSSKRRADAADSLALLKRGDIIVVPSGRRAGPAVVIDPGVGQGSDDPRPLVLTLERQVRRLSVVDFTSPVQAVGRLRIPPTFNARSAHSRRDLASALRQKSQGIEAPKRPAKTRGAGDDAEVARLRSQLRAHPCHGCDEREAHARWAERFYRLQSENRSLEQRVSGRTNSIARQFDRVCEVLHGLGYLTGSGDGAEVTPAGDTLARIYTESDLLVAECLRSGLWDGLTPPELAAACSALVYEARGSEDLLPRIPGGRIREVLDRMIDAWTELEAREKAVGLSFTRPPDLGFVWAIHRWASGATLDSVLTESDLTPGDFVRWTKQVVDLLGQVSNASADDAIRETARAATDAIARGVISYSSLS